MENCKAQKQPDLISVLEDLEQAIGVTNSVAHDIANGIHKIKDTREPSLCQGETDKISSTPDIMTRLSECVYRLRSTNSSMQETRDNLDNLVG